MVTGDAGLQTIQVPSPQTLGMRRSFLQFVSDQTAHFRCQQRERQEQSVDQKSCEQHRRSKIPGSVSGC